MPNERNEDFILIQLLYVYISESYQKREVGIVHLQSRAGLPTLNFLHQNKRPLNIKHYRT